MDRPRLPKGEAKGTAVIFRLTTAERRELEAAAKRDGLDLSDWCRVKMMERANEQLTPRPPPKPVRGAATFRMGDKAEFVIYKELTPEEAKRFTEVAVLSAEGMTVGT
jgi:hypothetical protein